MSGGGEIIIRNGTLKQWWNYEVVLGGKAPEAYEGGAIVGGIRIKGKWLVVTAVVLALAAAGFVL